MCSLWTSKRVTHMSHFSFQQTHYSHALLHDGMRSEKCVVRRSRRRRANTMECTYTNLAGRGHRTPRLCGRAYCSWAYTARHHTEQQETPSSARENDATGDATNTRCMRRLPV